MISFQHEDLVNIYSTVPDLLSKNFIKNKITSSHRLLWVSNLAT